LNLLSPNCQNISIALKIPIAVGRTDGGTAALLQIWVPSVETSGSYAGSNDAGDVVGGSNTLGDAQFHATLWRNGRAVDLGTLDGDCFSDANAIGPDGEIVGSSVSCDGGTVRAVLWDHKTIIDLNSLIPANSNLRLFGADNINDRGEIAGRGLPAPDRWSITGSRNSCRAMSRLGGDLPARLILPELCS
jgi:probable HAF family extracellular repeat protein